MANTARPPKEPPDRCKKKPTTENSAHPHPFLPQTVIDQSIIFGNILFRVARPVQDLQDIISYLSQQNPTPAESKKLNEAIHTLVMLQRNYLSYAQQLQAHLLLTEACLRHIEISHPPNYSSQNDVSNTSIKSTTDSCRTKRTS